MFDLIARVSIAVVYLGLGAKAVYVARCCAMQRARKLSSWAIGGLSFGWAAFWVMTVVLSPTLSDNTALIAWLSRIVHIPQVAGIWLMVTLICDTEQI